MLTMAKTMTMFVRPNPVRPFTRPGYTVLTIIQRDVDPERGQLWDLLEQRVSTEEVCSFVSIAGGCTTDQLVEMLREHECRIGSISYDGFRVISPVCEAHRLTLEVQLVAQTGHGTELLVMRGQRCGTEV